MQQHLKCCPRVRCSQMVAGVGTGYARGGLIVYVEVLHTGNAQHIPWARTPHTVTRTCTGTVVFSWG